MKKLFARIAAWVRAILRGSNETPVVGGGDGGGGIDRDGVSHQPEVVRQD